MMQQKACDDELLTTNADYGSFYFGRSQRGRIDPNEIAMELTINDQVRHERCQIPSIAYNVMFDKADLLRITAHKKSKHKPIVSRRQLKYIQFNPQLKEKHEQLVKNALKTYSTFIECIYKDKLDQNPQLSESVLTLLANEILLLNPELSDDELAEYLVAVTVPTGYLGLPSINPNEPYPGKESDCRRKSPFERVQEKLDECKNYYDWQKIESTPMHGLRYVTKPSMNNT